MCLAKKLGLRAPKPCRPKRTEAFDPQPPGGKALGEPQLVGGPGPRAGSLRRCSLAFALALFLRLLHAALYQNEHRNFRVQKPEMYLTKTGRDARSSGPGLLGERLSGRPGAAVPAVTTLARQIPKCDNLAARFFFPGGYTHWVFALLAVCHAYIYARTSSLDGFFWL